MKSRSKCIKVDKSAQYKSNAQLNECCTRVELDPVHYDTLTEKVGFTQFEADNLIQPSYRTKCKNLWLSDVA